MADESSKSRKRKMKFEGSKARRKSKKEEPLSVSSSSEPSESSSSYSYHYRKKTKSKKDYGRGRGRNRNVSADCNDRQRSLQKDKKQERHKQQRREDLEKKRRRSKRSPSPMKQRKRSRYRSVSTCSDSSRSTRSTYLSDTCSTCSTYSRSGEGTVKKKRSNSSKKSYRRWGVTKRNGHKEPENKKATNSCKNVRDELDTESTKRKPCGQRDSNCSLVQCLDNDMLRKKKRDLAVGRDNLLVDGQEDSCDDGKHSSEPLSSVVKFGIGGQVFGNAASDAVALESLLRKKALENLIKFRRFESGTTKIPLSYESEKPLFADSREDDGTGSGLCGTMEFRRDEQNLTVNIPDEHLSDVRRDAYRQTSKDALNRLVHDTFGTDKTCRNRHKKSQIELIHMNEEHTCKSEIAELEEPVMITSQECGLRTDIVSNRSTCEVLEACTSKFEKSQTHMFPVGKDNPLPMEMPPLDVITMPSKNKTSKTEMTKDDKAATESLDIDASRIGVPNLDDPNLTKLKESSFQQKTMAVRHGGEAVQVSYKVYIPERSAAMARRQLKR